MGIDKVNPQKIASYDLVQQARDQAQTGAAQGKPADQRASRTDTVSLSDRGQGLRKMNDLVRQAPEVRAELVADIKAQVQAGTYQVSDERLASQIVASFGAT